MIEVHQTAAPPRIIRTSDGLGQKNQLMKQTVPDDVLISGLKCRRIGFDVFDDLKNQAVVPIECAFDGVSPETDPFMRLFLALGAHVLSQGIDIVVVSV